MKKAFFFLIFLIQVKDCSSQVAGYMGKRTIISYSNYFMAGIRGPGPNRSNYLDERSFTINRVHCLNFDYVYKQRKIICLSAQYLRIGVAYDRGSNEGFFSSASQTDYPYPGSTRYTGDFKKPAVLSSINIAMALKLFREGFVAPVGTYQKFEMLMLFEKIQYDNAKFAKPVSDNQAEDVAQLNGEGEYNYLNFALVYSVGKQRVLRDKFVLDYGVRAAITPAMNIISVTSLNDRYSTMEMYYKRHSNARISNQQLLNFYLGIGFLAFKI